MKWVFKVGFSKKNPGGFFYNPAPGSCFLNLTFCRFAKP